VRIRLARGTDAAAIVQIQERGWQTAYRHVFPPEELDRGGFVDERRWRETIRRPPAGWTTFVAERDDRVIGFACLGPSRDEQGLGELFALYVDPGAWRLGAGRALIAAAERQLAREHDDARLWVLERNDRARRFYEASGWVPDGARKTQLRFGVAAAEVRYSKPLARTAAAGAREPGA